MARTFTTEIVQDGNILTDGNSRNEFNFVESDVHQFNGDGTRVCTEFRRRAISNCMSHASRVLGEKLISMILLGGSPLFFSTSFQTYIMEGTSAFVLRSS